MPLPTLKVVTDTPESDNGDTDESPSPAPSVSSRSDSAAAATAPATMAGHDTQEVRRSATDAASASTTSSSTTIAMGVSSPQGKRGSLSPRAQGSPRDQMFCLFDKRAFREKVPG